MKSSRCRGTEVEERGGMIRVRLFGVVGALLLAGCARESELVPGRGAAMERGPVAKVYPAGEPAREDRHGLWRGVDAEGGTVWEVQFTRGLPTGPYREWNGAGDLIATWPYNWDGKIEGWARWFENGEPVFKRELTSEEEPGFDPIGRAEDLRTWAEETGKDAGADDEGA